MNRILNWLPRGWGNTIVYALISALLLWSWANNAQAANPTFNIYSPAPGIQYNPGTTPYNSTATAAQVGASYTGASGCTGAVPLLFNGTCGSGSGSGSVTSVSITVPSPLSASGCSGTTVITCAITWPGLATVAQGGSGAGSLTGVLKGNGTSAFSAALAADTAATYTGASGCTGAVALLFNATCAALSTGSVTSVGFADTSTTPIYSFSGSPVTSSGTIDQTLVTQSAHFSFMGPTSGSAAQPAFRALVAGDIPALSYVTSVGFSDASTTPIYTFSGSPVTSSGTIAQTLATQSANSGFFGPTTGSAAQPGFRALVNADLPATAVTPGSYTSANITVNQQGVITAAANGSGSGCSFANPTASIGLSAINGSATTCMRSDAAPLLSQAIAPTWTAFHQFTDALLASGGTFPGVSTTGAYVSGRSSVGIVDLINSGAPANARVWSMFADGSGNLNIGASNDTVSGGDQLLLATRTGTTVTGLTLGNATDLPPISLDGPVSFNGGAGLMGGFAGSAAIMPNQNFLIFQDAAGGYTSPAYFYTDSSSGFTIGVGGQDLIYVTPAGNVSFGSSTTGPSLQLTQSQDAVSPALTIAGNGGGAGFQQYQGSGGAGELYNVGVGVSATDEYDIFDATASAARLRISAAGGVALPSLSTSSAAKTGTVCWETGTGALTVDATTTCLASASRFKHMIAPLTFGLDEVMKLRPVTYHLLTEIDAYKLGEQVGFIAEEAQKVDPRLVGSAQDGKITGFRYQQYTAVLTLAIQEQQREILELKIGGGLLAAWCGWLTYRGRNTQKAA